MAEYYRDGDRIIVDSQTVLTASELGGMLAQLPALPQASVLATSYRWRWNGPSWDEGEWVEVPAEPATPAEGA